MISDEMHMGKELRMFLCVTIRKRRIKDTASFFNVKIDVINNEIKQSI